MSDIGLTSSQISAAGAYAQADRLVVTIPVRAIDPTRQRFQVEDQATAQDAPGKAKADTAADDESPSLSARSRSGSGRGGFALVGAFTSFLARMFGQGEVSQTAATASAQSGAQAYARAAGGVTGESGAMEILPPSFPRLASGRAVDLVI